MEDLAEKRVFGDRAGATELVVAAASGVVVVSLSDGRVGEFGLARECSPTDLAIGPGPTGRHRLAVATDEDVLLADGNDIDALGPSGFGPAVATTISDGRVVAAGPDGRLAVHDGAGWTTIDGLASTPTSLAGDLVGTAEGVYRLVDGSLRPAGLADVNDVALAAGTPLAATKVGLYELGNGWLDVLEGEFTLAAGAIDGRSHAASADAVFERSEGAWSAVELPTESRLTAVAYGPHTYLLDSAGDLLVAAANGFDRTPLGLEGVVAAAVR